MEYGHEEKGGPQELADSEAPERSILTSKAKMERPTWMAEDGLNSDKRVQEVKAKVYNLGGI